MFDRLKNKWKVSTNQFAIIICTFALGGSLCGFFGRQILTLLSIDNTILYVIAYIITVTLLWPVCVILISIPLGQFPFFKKYLSKIKKRMFGN